MVGRACRGISQAGLGAPQPHLSQVPEVPGKAVHLRKTTVSIWYLCDIYMISIWFYHPRISIGKLVLLSIQVWKSFVDVTSQQCYHHGSHGLKKSLVSHQPNPIRKWEVYEPNCLKRLKSLTKPKSGAHLCHSPVGCSKSSWKTNHHLGAWLGAFKIHSIPRDLVIPSDLMMPWAQPSIWCFFISQPCIWFPVAVDELFNSSVFFAFFLDKSHTSLVPILATYSNLFWPKFGVVLTAPSTRAFAVIAPANFAWNPKIGM